MSKKSCGKITYSDKDNAWKAAIVYYKQYGDVTKVMKCGKCTKYHLTSKNIRRNEIPLKYLAEFQKTKALNLDLKYVFEPLKDFWIRLKVYYKIKIRQ